VITDLPPAPGSGEWSLSYVECNGEAVASSEGRIDVSLTPKHPDLDCAFTNTFDPTPPAPPAQVEPPSPEAHLVVTKRATSPSAIVGDVITYEVTVLNQGPGPTGEVSLVDQPLSAASLVSVGTDTGSCGDHLPLVCTLGTSTLARRRR
jgi:uncharacterized repeat protein (TIGR01451 family)